MRSLFAADEVAALFALYSQPIPPNVAEYVSDRNIRKRLRALDAVQASLVDSGAFVVGSGGDLELEDDLSELLRVCFNADAAVAFDVAGSAGPVFYRLDDAIVLLEVRETGVEMRRLGGADEADAKVAAALGVQEGDAVDSYTVVMSLGQLDEMLGLVYRRRDDEFEAIAARNQWDASAVSDIIRRTVDEATVRITTVQPGSENELDTRLCVEGANCWLIKCAMVAGAAYALLRRGPVAHLFDLVSNIDTAEPIL